MKILIVEDTFTSRAMVSKVLADDGHEIIVCENGNKAWEIIQQQPVQMVITDWMMPEMDGLSLCRMIRNASYDHYIYIIVLTSRDSKGDLVAVFQAGADDYISKPFNPNELRARVGTGARMTDLEYRHKNLQQKLLENHNKLRTVLDSLEEEIVAVSPDYKIESVNKAFSNIVSASADDLAGKSCRDLGDQAVKGFCGQSIKSLITQVFEQGRPQRALQRVEGEDGSARNKRFAILPVKDDVGKVVQVIVVAKDVTEEHRRIEEINGLNERLTAASAQLEEKNRNLETALKQLQATQALMLQSEKMASIGQLAAGVAHEINNPTGFVSSNLKTLDNYKDDLHGLITKYQSLADLLKKPDMAAGLSPEAQNALQTISVFENNIDISYIMNDIGDLIKDCREGTERIKKIVLDLKDFAHPGEDKPVSVDINKGLESTLNVVHNEIKYKAVVETQFGVIPTVSGYPQQLNQVFMNILVNAAQAIERQGRITVKTIAENGSVVVTISDTGCGIPPQNIPKIFDPFFTTKEVGKGTGLGMNIAYNIVKKHHGAIEVQSEVGKGTTFTVRLPVEAEEPS